MPNSGVYRELIPEGLHSSCLYDGRGELVAGRLQDVTDRALKKKGARVLLAQVALRVTR